MNTSKNYSFRNAFGGTIDVQIKIRGTPDRFPKPVSVECPERLYEHL
jgi:hypothetical protein